jgi:alkylation response protein AidB-like acyl-CoA dehydrogenase
MGLAKIKTAEGRDEPLVCCYFAKSDVKLHDTWFVSGLRGTGSCDFEVYNAFVPMDHTHLFVDLKPTHPALLYRLPGLSAFAWTVSVVPLGIARGAIDTFIELAGKKARQGSTMLMRDGELVQDRVGRAETTLRAARAYLVDAMAELMVATDVGGDRLLQARRYDRRRRRHRGHLRNWHAGALGSRRPCCHQACGNESEQLHHRRSPEAWAGARDHAYLRTTAEIPTGHAEREAGGAKCPLNSARSLSTVSRM